MPILVVQRSVQIGHDKLHQMHVPGRFEHRQTQVPGLGLFEVAIPAPRRAGAIDLDQVFDAVLVVGDLERKWTTCIPTSEM